MQGQIDFSKPVNIKAFLYNEFGVCGCSDTYDVLSELKNFLEWADKKERKSFSILYSTEGLFYLVAGMCDKADLIDHGVAIRHPFLSPRGYAFLQALREISFNAIDEASGMAYDECHYGNGY